MVSWGKRESFKQAQGRYLEQFGLRNTIKKHVKVV